MRIIQIIGRMNCDLLKVHSSSYNYGQHCLILLSSTDIRSFHSSSIYHGNGSKVERTVNLLKKDSMNETKGKLAVPKTTLPILHPDVTSSLKSTQLIVIKRKSIGERIVHELKHYYNGSKLLFIETRIAFRLFRRVLNGDTLTRRERKQFTRTAADLFRLVPFSIFIIVPFMEFTLPIFLKLFPNMLPSTFKVANKEYAKLKKQFKVKLEVAKFLQDTLESTALKSKKKRSDDALSSQFIEFMKKIRSTGVQPSTEEIMKFSSLFENKSTLDNLDRPHLAALCKLIGTSSIGPDYYLRFILDLKIRNLVADDKLIESEGMECLNVEELQAACRERGMRAYGMSIERLRSQLQQWLDLHLNKRIPSTILLLSRALYLPENISQENVLKATIQSLPKSIENVTAVKLAEVSGERVDNTRRIEYIKREDQAIRKEEEEKKKKQSTASFHVPKAELLVDKAPIIEQHIDVRPFETALEQLVTQKAQEVRRTVEEIRDLKAIVKVYKDDVKELQTLTAAKQLKHLSETRSAKALSKRIDKLVIDLNQIVQALNKKQDILKKDIQTEENTLNDEILIKRDQIQQHKDFFTEKKNLLISTQEFVNTILQIQKFSSLSTDAQVWDIIDQFDHNKDGFIEAGEILKTLVLIDNEKVQISKKHLKEIIDLIHKEHIVEKFESKVKQQSMQ